MSAPPIFRNQNKTNTNFDCHITNITISSTFHRTLFFLAASWNLQLRFKVFQFRRRETAKKYFINIFNKKKYIRKFFKKIYLKPALDYTISYFSFSHFKFKLNLIVSYKNRFDNGLEL